MFSNKKNQKSLNKYEQLSAGAHGGQLSAGAHGGQLSAGAHGGQC